MMARAEFNVDPIRARHMESNALGHYCMPITPGCDHCWASTRQRRHHMPPFKLQMPGENVNVFIDRGILQRVLRRREPSTLHWCAMSDFFGAWVLRQWQDEMIAVMALTPWHRHVILTKRIDRAWAYFMPAHRTDDAKFQRISALTKSMDLPDGFTRPDVAPDWPLPHLELGVSVEDQERANLRLRTLFLERHEQRLPVGKRFVVVEPVLEQVNLTYSLCLCKDRGEAMRLQRHDFECPHNPRWPRPLFDRLEIGGEVGQYARPNNLQWVRSLIQQAARLGVPAHVRQLGSFPTLTPLNTAKWEAAGKPAPVRLGLHSPSGSDRKEWPIELWNPPQTG